MLWSQCRRRLESRTPDRKCGRVKEGVRQTSDCTGRIKEGLNCSLFHRALCHRRLSCRLIESWFASVTVAPLFTFPVLAFFRKCPPQRPLPLRTSSAEPPSRSSRISFNYGVLRTVSSVDVSSKGGWSLRLWNLSGGMKCRGSNKQISCDLVKLREEIHGGFTSPLAETTSLSGEYLVNIRVVSTFSSRPLRLQTSYDRNMSIVV